VVRLARSVEMITQRPTIGSFLSSGNYKILSADAKPGILRRQGSIAKHFNPRAGGRTAIVYAHNIDSPLAHWWEVTQVLPCHFGYFAAFMPVDSRLWRFYLKRRSCFHFNKAQNILVPSDQVDLSTASRRAVVTCHHGVADFPQMKVGRVLTLPADLMADGCGRRRQEAPRRPIERSDDEMCGSS
jgi:hypothetical protein